MLGEQSTERPAPQAFKFLKAGAGTFETGSKRYIDHRVSGDAA